MILLIIVSILIVYTILSYKAYRQRFPSAKPWTFLFRGGK